MWSGSTFGQQRDLGGGVPEIGAAAAWYSSTNPKREGGCQEDTGDADGGGDEERQESPVDGVLGRPRLGKERRVPQDACVISPLYFMINMEL